uniref:Uncharacterized protein n=1 Tax=Arundo donax TaxID=35708 RepID=A0A0A9BQ82_ARUDO
MILPQSVLPETGTHCSSFIVTFPLCQWRFTGGMHFVRAKLASVKHLLMDLSKQHSSVH